VKVVILAGGKGSRISEYTKKIPKPMIEIVGKTIIEHIIQIYSDQLYNEFYILTGNKGNIIKKFFNKYKLRNNLYKFKDQDKKIKINFIHTGINTMTGGRIKKLSKIIKNENFMVTYGDGLANINLQKLEKFHLKHKKIATVTAVRPLSRYGILDIKKNTVMSFKEKLKLNYGWINGGYFVFNSNIFKYLKSNNTVLEKFPLESLAKKRQLKAFKHEGFWYSIDTKRDKENLEAIIKNNKIPWKN
tara:strand:+ start:1822 stop:2556 length:735 start_codon:yes stop_codon:yes gene_type:complete